MRKLKFWLPLQEPKWHSLIRPSVHLTPSPPPRGFVTSHFPLIDLLDNTITNNDDLRRVLLVVQVEAEIYIVPILAHFYPKMAKLTHNTSLKRPKHESSIGYDYLSWSAR